MADRVSGVSPVRFAAAAGAGGAVALGLGVAIILGVIPVHVAAKEPMEIYAAHGTVSSLQVIGGGLDGIGGATTAEASEAGAAITATRANVDGLCLIPRFDVPFLGTSVGIRLRSLAPVRIDDITLGVSEAGLNGLHLPQTSLGRHQAEGFTPTEEEIDRVSGLAEVLGVDAEDLARVGTAGQKGGALSLQVEESGATMQDFHSTVYKLTLTKGIRLTSVRLWAGLDDLHCS